MWRGVSVAPLIPETLTPNELALTCWLEVEVDFRGRRPDFAEFSSRARQDEMEEEESHSEDAPTPERALTGQ